LLLALGALARRRRTSPCRAASCRSGRRFRIPEIMARSGARLMEIGSTNRTHKKTTKGRSRRRRLLLKVHRSIFR